MALGRKNSTAPAPPGENIMGTKPINKLLITISAPMMVSMLIQALYNVVDSMFVSYISEGALTAVSIAYPLQNLVIAVATGTCVGMNALLSRNLGEKDYDQVSRVAGNTIVLCLLSSLVIALIGIFLTRPYFELQVEDPAIIELGCDYLFWIMVLSVACFGQMLTSRLLQSTGKTFYAMVIQLAGAGLNIILDPILIFGLFGFPALGVTGAAIATIISQFVGTGIGVWCNLKRNQEIRFSLGAMRPNGGIISRIYSVGFPTVLMQSVGSILTFGLNQILVVFSETAVAIYGVYFKLQSFVFLPIIGMNNGMVPIIAFNYGARKPDRIHQTIKLAMTYSAIIMLVGTVLFQVATAPILSIFQASPDMLELGVPAIRTMCIFLVIGGFSIVAGSVLQALGKGFHSMSISVFRQLVLVLPLAWAFSLTGNLSLVWWAFPIAEFLAGGLSLYHIRSVYRHIIYPLADGDYKF